MEGIYKQQQIIICEKYRSGFLATPFNSFIGIALETFEKKLLPINGLRHPIQSAHSSNWYIWCGEEFSQAGDFFKPVHTEHLVEMCPSIIKYLGLNPGWRFLQAGDYEDVWFDASLLNI
ncbi:MAG: hypothetical protein IAF38_10380 [Bacteroidia bacterium]|nr:hypothetical protein [Bacteroidia bacterium]